jgi:putative glutamine amidotransferase
MTLRIATTGAAAHAPRYEAWLRAARLELELVDLGALEWRAALDACHGLLLPGGVDVHPRRYGRPDLRPRCRTVDEERDELELGCVETALASGLPLLGVCRGLQLVNVALGGTLVADLPDEQRAIHDKLAPPSGGDRQHAVDVASGSLLARLAGASPEPGIVSSAHHQAADAVAPDLVAAARARDGVIEALERRRGAADASFLLLVQWHPERMPPSPLSAALARAFLDAAAAFETR